MANHFGLCLRVGKASQDNKMVAVLDTVRATSTYATPTTFVYIKNWNMTFDILKERDIEREHVKMVVNWQKHQHRFSRDKIDPKVNIHSSARIAMYVRVDFCV